MVHGPQQMPADAKEVLHDAVHRGETLQVRGRLEPPHLALPLSCGLVRDFGAVVRILIRTVDDRRHHYTARRRVTAEFVGDQPARDTALPLQQRPEEPYRGATIPTRLHEDVQQVAVLVDRAPQVLLATVQGDE